MYRFENMKKALKIYGWIWVATILATLITVAVLKIHTSHHDLAEDPNNLEKIVKVDMPDIAFVESENNLSRSASRWDIYEHKGKFIHELSEDTITALDELCLTDSLHWHKANNRVVYSYYNEGGIDELYHVFCLISHDGFIINYEVDESEGIFVLFPLIIAYVILLAWGIILFIINLFRRIQKQT